MGQRQVQQREASGASHGSGSGSWPAPNTFAHGPDPRSPVLAVPLSTLQATSGNRAASRVLARATTPVVARKGCDCSKGSSGSCACAGSKAEELPVSQPGDAFEREADYVAAQVMSTPGPAVQRACACSSEKSGSGGCAECSKTTGTSDRSVRRMTSAGPGRGDGAAPVTTVVPGAGGHPLDTQTRGFMEERFGHDFSGVRVHTNAEAERSARAFDAHAYTVGNDIVFSSGRYQPGSTAGRHLLAHELTHVVQQRAGVGSGMVHRQACGHDGRQPECGGYRWRLIDIATDEVTNEDLDYRIVEYGIAPTLGGTWASQVQTPPNALKGGLYRGRVDGMRVQAAGALSVEVVEVKSRATGHNGGCALATKEAKEYVRILTMLSSDIVAVSQVLATHPELRAAGAGPNAAQRRALAGAGVDLSRQSVRHAWKFLLSLENQLGRQFSTGFTAFEAALYTGGRPGTDYRAGPPVFVDCTKGGKPGVKIRQLMFQVNGAGGVSYGCTNTPCQVTDAEREQVKDVRVPAVEEEGEEVEGQPTQQVSDQPTAVPIPVLVGVGGGALTAAALAAARRKAAEVAAREAALALARREATKRAAQAAWRRAAEAAARRRAERAAAAGAGKRLGGKAVGRAVVVAEAAAIVLLLASGEAKAQPGPGKSSLEVLYDLMTRNGAPPSPEMREMIENDPVLRQLAEQATESGDGSGLQRELDRRGLELLRDHAHELTDEELELLLSSSAAQGAGGEPPATVEQLKAALTAERERRRIGAQAPGGTSAAAGSGIAEKPGGTGANAGVSGGTGSDGRATKEGTGSGGGTTRDGANGSDRPDLPQEVRRELTDAPGPQRRIVEQLISHQGGGPKADADGVRRILAAVPKDLTGDEADRLVARIGPAAGKTVDEIVETVRRAVTEVRAAEEHGRAESTGADAGDVAPDAAEEADTTRADYVDAILEDINGYPYWDSIKGVNIWPLDEAQNLMTEKLDTPIGLILRGKRPSGNGFVRFAGTGWGKVTARTSTTVTVELTSPMVVVGENRRTVTHPAGYVLRKWRLTGGGQETR